MLVGGSVAVTAFRRPDDDLPSLREARQMLVPADRAPKAVQVGDDTPTRGFRTVVFFIPDGHYRRFVQAIGGWSPLADGRADHPADVVAVLPHEPQGPSVTTPVGGDPTGTIARAYDIALPSGGEDPVGFAIVDSRLRVRYATADADVLSHLERVASILEAVP